MRERTCQQQLPVSRHPFERDAMSIIEERYARAISSSHLEVKEGRGDADTIIAAGMANETLGVMLSRLRAEWDAAAGELLLYQRAQREWLRRADDEAVALKADPRRLSREAFCRSEADREEVTGRAMVLMGLRTLKDVKQALYRFAYLQAERRGVAATHPGITPLCGAVLTAWLDRKCHHCEGRGFNGGYREPQVRCRHCRGTGHRRIAQLHQVDALHAYGLWLLNVMDSKAAGAMSQVRRRTA